MRSIRDEAAQALYNERRKLLAGLMMSEAEPWEDLPEDVKERWRSKIDGAQTPEGSTGPGTHGE
ncbi:hypothetical protein [Nesterenkonia sandarakina]|uniref:Uncharacterized protein n=1 Tax=Nesterenkonia sandarakina TaxID=272918 RepID=A0A2T0YRG7_9MICC|nr:hypothetical protein [Nesterenkonia sandarakina]PRZ17823.1 hypothetical protein BCL67_104176 [Nesterenkonia sandarakina]